MPPTTPRSYSDYATEYDGFDMPAMLAEAATLEDTAPLNQAMAYSTRLLDLLADTDISAEHRVAGIRLATVVRENLEASLASDPARLAFYVRARDATYGRLLDFGRFPEVVRLALPKGWTPLGS